MSDFKVAVLPAAKRIRNFSEVVIGLGKKQAIEEAKFYLQRDGAEQGQGCPLGTDVFGFLRHLADGDIQGAYDVIVKTNPFPSITGRLFKEPYQKIQVFNKNSDLISVRLLERFVGDSVKIKKPGLLSRSKVVRKKVAIIGSGPAGLTAAAGLSQRGYDVTVFEAFHKAGGVLRYGYPEFRVPQKQVDRQIEFVQSLGVHIQLNSFLSGRADFQKLKVDGFEAIFVATGSGLSKKINIAGENAPGVYFGEEFLLKVNLMQGYRQGYETPLPIGKKVVIIGTGNAAFDCARTCVRLGAQVTIVAKWTKDDIAVRPYILEHALEEGIRLELMTNTLEILKNSDGCARGVLCRRFDYADKDEDGKWELVEVPNSEFEIQADTVIISIGHKANHLVVRGVEELTVKKDGRITTRRNSTMTPVDGVFAGGNVTDGPGPMINAMLSAQRAIKDIDEYLKD